MGKEHLKVKSIYRDYEDWEVQTLEAHECFGGSNRQTSRKLGMFLYISRDYHARLHNTHEGKLENLELQEEMKQLCLEHHNMSEEDFHEIFVKGNRRIRDSYLGGQI